MKVSAKKTVKLLAVPCLWLILLFICGGTSTLQAQTAAKILLNIPDSCFKELIHFTGEPFSISVRKKIIQNQQHTGYRLSVLDNKNGYLQIFTEGDGDNMELAICCWKMSGISLVAVVVNTAANCTNYTNKSFFYEAKNGVLKDRTRQLNPSISIAGFLPANCSDTALYQALTSQNIHCLWKLPRAGKSIEVTAPFYDCGEFALPESDHYFELTPLSTVQLKKIKLRKHD